MHQIHTSREIKHFKNLKIINLRIHLHNMRNLEMDRGSLTKDLVAQDHADLVIIAEINQSANLTILMMPVVNPRDRQEVDKVLAKTFAM